MKKIIRIKSKPNVCNGITPLRPLLSCFDYVVDDAAIKRFYEETKPKEEVSDIDPEVVKEVIKNRPDLTKSGSIFIFGTGGTN